MSSFAMLTAPVASVVVSETATAIDSQQAPISISRQDTPVSAEKLTRTLINLLTVQLFKYLKDYANQVSPQYTTQASPLLTKQLDILVELHARTFWDWLFRSKRRKYTTQPLEAWTGCNGRMDGRKTTVYIDPLTKTLYIQRYSRHQNIDGYVELTPNHLRGLSVEELQRLIAAAEHRIRIGSVLLANALQDRWSLDSAA